MKLVWLHEIWMQKILKRVCSEADYRFNVKISYFLFKRGLAGFMILDTFYTLLLGLLLLRTATRKKWMEAFTTYVYIVHPVVVHVFSERAWLTFRACFNQLNMFHKNVNFMLLPNWIKKVEKAIPRGISWKHILSFALLLVTVNQWERKYEEDLLSTRMPSFLKKSK